MGKIFNKIEMNESAPKSAHYKFKIIVNRMENGKNENGISGKGYYFITILCTHNTHCTIDVPTHRA